MSRNCAKTPAAVDLLCRVSEHDLQVQVFDWLRLCLLPSWKCRAGLEGLVIKSKMGRRKAKAAGREAGWPDLHFISASGQAFIELKTATGRMRPAQSLFKDWCKQEGIPHAVCRSLDEVRAKLREWGIPTREAR